MYFRKNDVPVVGGKGSIEGFSFDGSMMKNKKMWIYLLLLVVLIVIVVMVMKSRKQKPRFGLRFL
jgi:lipoprotein signal peptidase